MEVVTVLLVILVIAAIVTCVVGIWALREFGSASRSVRALADDTRVRIVPLLDKSDVTVDALNAELLRVDVLVTQFEDAARQVSGATVAIQELANAPERIAGGIADRVRTWRGRRRDAQSDLDDAPTRNDESISADEVTAVEAETAEHNQSVSEDPWQQIE